MLERLFSNSPSQPFPSAPEFRYRLGLPACRSPSPRTANCLEKIPICTLSKYETSGILRISQAQSM